MSATRLRAASWALVVLGAGLVVGLAGRAGEDREVVDAIGWATLAAVGASMLLGVWGRRVLGVLVALMGLGAGLVLAGGSASAALWAGVVLCCLGGLLQAITAHRWPSRASRFEQGGSAVQHPTSDLELWKALDAGLDPTADEFGGNVPKRETSPKTSTPFPGAGADTKDEP